MRFILASVLVALIASHAVAQKKISTIHGTIVEVTSYVKDGIKPDGAAGKEIALSNLSKGGALAILEKGTGRMYLIAAMPADTAYLGQVTGYLGAGAFIKGPVAMRNGIRVITMQDIGKSLK